MVVGVRPHHHRARPVIVLASRRVVFAGREGREQRQKRCGALTNGISQCEVDRLERRSVRLERRDCERETERWRTLWSKLSTTTGQAFPILSYGNGNTKARFDAYDHEDLPSSEALHSIRVHVQMHGENEAVLHEDMMTISFKETHEHGNHQRVQWHIHCKPSPLQRAQRDASAGGNC